MSNFDIQIDIDSTGARSGKQQVIRSLNDIGNKAEEVQRAIDKIGGKGGQIGNEMRELAGGLRQVGKVNSGKIKDVAAALRTISQIRGTGNLGIRKMVSELTALDQIPKRQINMLPKLAEALRDLRGSYSVRVKLGSLPSQLEKLAQIDRKAIKAITLLGPALKAMRGSYTIRVKTGDSVANLTALAGVNIQKVAQVLATLRHYSGQKIGIRVSSGSTGRAVEQIERLSRLDLNGVQRALQTLSGMSGAQFSFSARGIKSLERLAAFDDSQLAAMAKGMERLAPAAAKVGAALKGMGDFSRAANTLEKVERKMRGLEGQARRTGGAVKGLSLNMDMLRGALGFFGITLISFALRDFINNIYDASIAVERISNSLEVATGTAQAAAREFNFLRSAAASTGADIRTAADQYAQLAVAGTEAGVAQQDIQATFTAVNKAMTVLGRSAEDAKLSFLAIGQMMSKGAVQSEELRRQLGERMPGAVQIMAKAAQDAGIIANGTVGELFDEMKTGIVATDEVLGHFARRVDDKFAAQIEKALGRADTQLRLLKNEVFFIQKQIGEAGFMDALADGARELRAALAGDEAQAAAQQIGRALGNLVEVAATGLKAVIENFEDFVRVAKILGTIGLAAIIYRISKAVVGLSMAVRGLRAAGGGVYKLIDVLAGGAAALVGSFLAVENVAASMTDAGNQLDRSLESLDRLGVRSKTASDSLERAMEVGKRSVAGLTAEIENLDRVMQGIDAAALENQKTIGNVLNFGTQGRSGAQRMETMQMFGGKLSPQDLMDLNARAQMIADEFGISLRQAMGELQENINFTEHLAVKGEKNREIGKFANLQARNMSEAQKAALRQINQMIEKSEGLAEDRMEKVVESAQAQAAKARQAIVELNENGITALEKAYEANLVPAKEYNRLVESLRKNAQAAVKPTQEQATAIEEARKAMAFIKGEKGEKIGRLLAKVFPDRKTLNNGKTYLAILKEMKDRDYLNLKKVSPGFEGMEGQLDGYITKLDQAIQDGDTSRIEQLLTGKDGKGGKEAERLLDQITKKFESAARRAKTVGLEGVARARKERELEVQALEKQRDSLDLTKAQYQEITKAIEGYRRALSGLTAAEERAEKQRSRQDFQNSLDGIRREIERKRLEVEALRNGEASVAGRRTRMDAVDVVRDAGVPENKANIAAAQELMKARAGLEKQTADLERAEELRQSVMTDSEKQAKKLAEIERLRGELSAETLSRLRQQFATDGLTGLRRGLDNYISEVETSAEAMEKIFNGAVSGMEDAFVEFAQTGKLSFTDMVNSMVADIARLSFRKSLASGMSELNLGGSDSGGGFNLDLGNIAGMFDFGGGSGKSAGGGSDVGGGAMAYANKLAGGGSSGGGSGGGFWGSLVNGAMSFFADGGVMTKSGPLPLNAYSKGGVANSPQMALYGEERRPEAYVPLEGGRHIPVSVKERGGQQGGQGNGAPTIVMNIYTQDADSFRKSKGQIMDDLRVAMGSGRA